MSIVSVRSKTSPPIFQYAKATTAKATAPKVPLKCLSELADDGVFVAEVDGDPLLVEVEFVGT